jgi:hypothetical protein
VLVPGKPFRYGLTNTLSTKVGKLLTKKLHNIGPRKEKIWGLKTPSVTKKKSFITLTPENLQNLLLSQLQAGVHSGLHQKPGKTVNKTNLLSLLFWQKQV